MILERTLFNFRICFAAAAALSLGACSQLAESNPPAYAPTHQERFPIKLANAPETLEVFPMQYASLDNDQKLTVADFGKDFRRSSKSVMSVAVPADVNGRVDAQTAAHAKQILKTLQDNGVARSAVRGQTYLPNDPTGLNPIKLTYVKAKAAVTEQCGLWPDDTGFASIEPGIENLPYYNHGCATQQAIAKQMADPMDVVRQHRPSPVDAARATAVISTYRGGPTTSSADANTSSTNGGGSNASGNSTSSRR
ncbi:CpaD family pilus assembly protein [Bosea massiliensis]|uniref:CpaD family pilus assembly protein n=1 Tax=Bosea massiliensis TaxID=151419 RepID=A0ABW0P0I1_9HYPH